MQLDSDSEVLGPGLRLITLVDHVTVLVKGKAEAAGSLDREGSSCSGTPGVESGHGGPSHRHGHRDNSRLCEAELEGNLLTKLIFGNAGRRRTRVLPHPKDPRT
jgi:hypothetical protein